MWYYQYVPTSSTMYHYICSILFLSIGSVASTSCIEVMGVHVAVVFYCMCCCVTLGQSNGAMMHVDVWFLRQSVAAQCM